MQSASKTKEPVGITCQIIWDHAPDPRDPQSSKRLTANAGEYGVIYERSSGQLNVSLYRRNPPSSGWIHSSYVKEGVSQDQRVTFVALNPDANKALDLSRVTRPNHTLLAKSIAAAIMSMKQFDQMDRFKEQDVIFLRNDGLITDLVNRAISYMPSDVEAVLSKAQPREQDFSGLKQAQTNDHGEAVYVIIYKQSNGLLGFYVGTTEDLARRLYDHANVVKNLIAKNKQTRNTHYSFARSAEVVARVPLTRVQGKFFRRILEQAFILLVGSCCEGAMALPTNPDAEADLSASFLARADGLSFHTAAQNSFEAVGWVPISRRMRGIGLNWDSPMTATQAYGEKTIWVKTAIPEHSMLVFRRPIMKILNNFIPFPGKKFSFLAPPSVRTQVSQAYFSVEVMTNNQPHHAPYARLEQVGPYSNWTQMNEFGMALQYQRSDGQWEKCYYQMRQNLRKPTKHCARVGYEKAMMIYSMIMQIEFINPPAWMDEIIKTSPLRIKEISFDPLTRTIAVQNLNTVTAMQSPAVRAENHIRNDLLTAGLRIANSFPPNENKSRYRCDLCLLNEREHLVTPKCVPNPKEPDPRTGSTECQDCQVLRRPCTKTYGPRIVGPSADAAYGRPPLRIEPIAIAPMQLLRFGGEDTDLDEEEDDELRQARQALEAAQVEEDDEYDEGAGPE